MRILIIFLLLSINSFGQGLVKVNTLTHIVNTTQLVLKDMDLTVDGSLSANGVVKFINGNFTMNGDFNSGIGKFVFSNTTNHDHYLTTSSINNNTFYDLSVIGDVTTQYDLHLLSNIKVNNHLEIQSQKVNLNNYNIDLGTTGHIDGESDSQFLYDDPNIGTGYIQITTTIPSSTTINPGNLGLEITTHTNQMGVTTIKRYHKKSTIDGDILSSHRIFEVTPQYNGDDYGGNLNVDLRFKYFNDILNPIDDVTTLRLYRSGDGGLTWEKKGGSVDIDNGYVSVLGFNQFSQVTIGEDTQTPLPVELNEFYGKQFKTDNLLFWSTMSENNSSHFIVESSVNGVDWLYLANIKGSGNSQTLINYFTTDYGVNQSKYYKLTQYDFDGQNKTYGPIVINRDIINKTIIKYVNVLGQEVNPLNINGIVFEIYDDGTNRKTIKY
jgi:hypothetical protein